MDPKLEELDAEPLVPTVSAPPSAAAHPPTEIVRSCMRPPETRPAGRRRTPVAFPIEGAHPAAPTVPEEATAPIAPAAEAEGEHVPHVSRSDAPASRCPPSPRDGVVLTHPFVCDRPHGH